MSDESLFSNSSETDFTTKEENQPLYTECISMAKHFLSLDVSSMTDNEKAVNAVSQAVKECYQCIHQGIHNIRNIFIEGNTDENEMVAPYLTDLVSLLQLLIQFLKRALDFLTAEYKKIPDLPRTLNLVLIQVFSHCKDSESMYGDEINAYGDLLKDLFKTSHELQVLCFVIMDKHFMFDVTDEDSFAIFTVVLDLSVDIGEIVSDLDIKTMAEQWKGYVALCEKYAQDLKDNYTFDKCIKIFCKIISNNVTTCLLDGSDQKLIMRSLKVSSFLMKNLIKLCEVFDEFVLRDYHPLVDLLMTLMGLPKSYLRISGKSEQLIQKLTSQLGVAALPLLLQLMTNHNFAMDYFNFDLADDNESALGYLMLTTNIMKTMLERDTPTFYNIWLTDGTNILCNIFKQLPKCHAAFVSGVSSQSVSGPQGGVYEHLLWHAGALAATQQCQSYVTLEQEMLQSVLQEDIWRSTFATDLWCITAKFSPPELCHDQVTFLIDTYNTSFDELDNSPIKEHLASTIHRLFNTLPDHSRCQLLQQFPLKQGAHRQVWSAIELSSLPDSEYEDVWAYCVEDLKCVWEELKNKGCSAENVNNMINIINVMSTGPIPSSDRSYFCNMIMSFLHILSVFKELPLNHCAQDEPFDNCLVEFGSSVCRLTVTLLRSFSMSNAQLLMMFDIFLTISNNIPTPLKLGMLAILQILSHHEIPDDSITIILCEKIASLFETLLTDKDTIVRSKTFTVFHSFSLYTNKDIIVTKTVAKNSNLKENIDYFMQNGNMMNERGDLKERQNFKFVHKCNPVEMMGDFVSVKSQPSHVSNSDFDIGNIDSLFMDEMEEPPMKIPKYDDDEIRTVEIISRLDSDSRMLAEICSNTGVSSYNKSKLNEILLKIKCLIE